jgi:hypothetical protein
MSPSRFEYEFKKAGKGNNDKTMTKVALKGVERMSQGMKGTKIRN